jgi:ribonuclease D
MIQLIDTWEQADAACVRLRTTASTHRVLALDMEGAPLSTCTTLLQIALSPQEIFVFDVRALGQGLFDAAHLLPVLTDPNRIKLCYDCRGDAYALFHQHRVRPYGVYDLQIVYASLFPAAHGDGFLRGLHRALEKMLTPADARAFTMRKMAHKQVWSAEQPPPASVSPEMLAYAAGDVAHLFEMFRRWSPSFNQRTILAASMRRVALSIQGGDTRLPKSRIDFAPARPLRLWFVYPSSPDDDVIVNNNNIKADVDQGATTTPLAV